MKYYIETFGCQMNVYDSGKLEETLRENEFSEASIPAEADLIVVNTCSVRRHAEDRAFARIGELCLVRKTGAVLAVCGCMAQRLGSDILKKRGVDIVIGPDAYPVLLAAFEKARESGAKALDTTRNPEFRFGSSGKHVAGNLRAFVSIMKGCSNGCSFCIVPAVRGPAVSRPCQEVEEEVMAVARAGARDITLIGQNVNAYRSDGVSFAELLGSIAEAAGEVRIRFTTSHPRDMNDCVIKTMSGHGNICEHLHLPLQSGSDRVLERMRRGYTADQYRGIVGAVRESVPGISITTDIMVGFPGETAEDFEATCRLVEEIEFDSAFMFKFSPRPGTEAASMDDDVPQSEKERRLSRLAGIEHNASSAKSARLVGKTLEVLIESQKTKNGEKVLLGKTRCNRTVHLKGPAECIGETVNVTIESSKGISLKGSSLQSQSGRR